MESAASSTNKRILIQKAFDFIKTLGLFAYLNPYTGCAKNGTAFDYIIVGGGTSGAVLGNRLSADPAVSVLVIEAGGNYETEVVYPYTLYLTKGSSFDWKYELEYNDDYAKCHQDGKFKPTLAKVLGGGSSVDYMIYSRGFDRDYNNWAKIGNESSWRFENVQRLFNKLEKYNDLGIRNSPDAIYHGFEGNLGLTKDKSELNDKYFIAFDQVGRKTVRDFNNGTRFGFSGAVYYINDRKRQNSALAYLYPVRNRTNLVVLKETEVTKIIIDELKRAKGVVAMTKDNRTFVFKAKREVIVTAGNFNTVKLLQLSGIGPKKLLQSFNISVVADLPVGLNYQNRVAAVVVFAVREICKIFVPEMGNPFTFPSGTIEGYVALNSSQLYPDYRTITFPEAFSPANIFLDYSASIFRFSNGVIDCVYDRLKGREQIFTLIQNLKPESRGEVRIRSANPFDPPFIDGKYYSNKKDLENMAKYVKDFVKVLNSDYFRKVGAMMTNPASSVCNEFEEDSDDFWKCYVRCMMAPLNHNAGTVAMGKVVDGRLRVFGVKGLRVADASIMPDLIPGSTTGPTILIGENAAEMIIEDNRKTG